MGTDWTRRREREERMLANERREEGMEWERRKEERSGLIQVLPVGS